MAAKDDRGGYDNRPTEVQRFDDLPPEVRKFFASLNEEKIQMLNETINVFKMVSNWCKVSKWIFIGVLGLLVMLSQGFDALKNLLGLRGH